MATLPHDGSFTSHSPKVLNFLHEFGKGGTSQSHAAELDLLEDESGGMEREISRLKEAVEKLEAEKEAGLAKFYKLLKKASFLESRIVSAEEESKVLKEQASIYEGEKISCLQKKLREAEDHAKRVDELVREAGDEIERLKKEVAKLEEEREVKKSSVLEKMGSMEKLMDERFSLEIEKGIAISFVDGVANNANQLLQKNVILEMEKELLISQVKESHKLIDGLKRELRLTLDNNEALVLEKSVIVRLFGELKIEPAEAEEERKALLEKFNNESRKVMELESNAESLNEILRQKEDERNEHEEKLKLEFEALNFEFSEVRESYQNLQTQMAKVVQENMVLRKNFAELKQQKLALCEDLVHYSKLQPCEAEQDLVATQNAKLHGENSIEVLNYGNKCSSLEKQRNSADVELLKETAKLDRTETVEKAVEYMTTRFSKPDDMHTEIKCWSSTPNDMHTEINCEIPKTLGEELTYQYSRRLDDDRSVCTFQHKTPIPLKSYIGLKMSVPRWGLKSSSKRSSVRSDAKKDASPDQIISNSKNAHYRKVENHQTGELWKPERGREKKHKGQITDIGKKLHLKNYLPISRSMSRHREGQQKNKRTRLWSCTQSPNREDSCHKVEKLE